MFKVQRITFLLVAVVAAVAIGCGSDRPDTATASASGNGGVTPGETTTTTNSGSKEPASQAPKQLFSAADRKSWDRLASSLSGAEGVAVSPVGRGQSVWTAGSFKRGVAWSTAKVPVAMAAIKAGTARQGDLVAAITASDNAAAERLWSSLGSPASAARAATRQVRAAGDSSTVIQSQRLRGSAYTAFGQTSWALSDQARFVAGMGCLAAGKRVLGLMGRVVSGQRWGLGSTGASAAFKGGWGPGIDPGSGNGWLDRQMGIIDVGGRKAAVTIGTTAGGHGAGTSNLTRMAGWVKSHVNPAALPATDRC